MTVMFHSAVAARQGLSATESDKRRVLIEIRREKLADLAGIFEDWKREVDELCEEFTVDELETVIRFLQGATERRRRATARLAE
ncbi:hypothetical protein [Streptomyces sp. NPDC021622]|uniref:hypothetical protein n=1 Tax=Streptomyces sp. NPDC021622 TaxID=3155013 RepID=UPI0033C69AB3